MSESSCAYVWVYLRWHRGWSHLQTEWHMVPCFLAITSDKWVGGSTVNAGHVKGWGSNGRALLNDLICACVCVCVCMSISTLRQYSSALCRWMWNRSCRLAAIYKYIITIRSRGSAPSGSERNVNSCLRACFSSLLRSDWKIKMFHTVPPPLAPSTLRWHPNTETPSFLQC